MPFTVTDNCVTVKVLPSTSVSLANNDPVAGESSATVTASSVATGASFTAVTVMFKVPVPEPPLVSVAV